MTKALRTGAAYLAAVVVGFVAASLLHSQLVLAGLSGIGARIGWMDRLRMTLGDVVGLAPTYGTIFGLALLAGFAVAWAVKRWLKPLAPIAYPVAGAAAIATALGLMRLQFEMTPLASARGLPGFLAHCGAGALAGIVFARLRPRAPALSKRRNRR